MSAHQPVLQVALKELGDLLWYLAVVANRLHGWSMSRRDADKRGRRRKARS